MPDLSPFPGIRYNLDAVDASLDDLTAPPYDVIDDESRASLEAAHSHNAVHLILPRDSNPNAGDRYNVAAALFRSWREGGILVDDPERLYLYRMGFTGDDGRPRQTSGVLGALAVGGDNSQILPHERTMPKPKSDRLDLLRATRANLDPIWGLTLSAGFTALLEPDGPPLARCTDSEGVHHRLYAIDARGRIAAIREAVAACPLLIADGHHRYETALAYNAEQSVGGSNDPKVGAILAFVTELAEDQLCVRPIHRLISGLPAGAMSRDWLASHFDVTATGPNVPDQVERLYLSMQESGALGLVDAEGLALLRSRQEACAALLQSLPGVLHDVDSSLFDVAIAQLLDPAQAEVSYQHDHQAIAAQVAKGNFDAGVLLRPVTVAQIHAAAMQQVRMPEKTTFFHPKPRGGLVFRSLD